jgi:hypothetical protein
MLHAAVLDDLSTLPDRVLVLSWSRASELAYSATLVRLALPMLEQAELRNNPLEYAASIHSMPETDCETATLVDGSGDARCAETLAYLRLASALLRASAGSIETGSRPNVDPAQLPFSTLAVAFEVEGLFAELPASARQRIAAHLQWKWEQGALVLSKPELERLEGVIVESISLATYLEATLVTMSQPSALGESMATSASVVSLARSAIVGIAELARITVELDGTRAANDPLRRALDDSAKLVAMSDAIQSEDWGSSALALFEIVDEMIDRYGDAEVRVSVSLVCDELGRYLPLFVEIANAKSSADVKAALEAAFPAGGYRLKYRQPAVALNGFLGLYGGGVIAIGPQPAADRRGGDDCPDRRRDDLAGQVRHAQSLAPGLLAGDRRPRRDHDLEVSRDRDRRAADRRHGQRHRRRRHHQRGAEQIQHRRVALAWGVLHRRGGRVAV